MSLSSAGKATYPEPFHLMEWERKLIQRLRLLENDGHVRYVKVDLRERAIIEKSDDRVEVLEKPATSVSSDLPARLTG